MVTTDITAKRSYKELFQRVRRIPWFPIILLSPMFICGIFGPLFWPHDPTAINLQGTLLPPSWLPGGDPAHFLGTDQLGRDLLSRLIEGARPSLLVSICGVLISGFLGVSIGIISGFFGRATDAIIMRVVDVWMSIPSLFFMLMIAAVLRDTPLAKESGGLAVIIISISANFWVGYARVIRGEVLSVREREYVALAKVTGVGKYRILRKHIFPNVTNTFLVMATTQLGGAIMAEASMTFLGIGVQPPFTAWGLLISDGRAYLSTAWWIPSFAGLCITCTILGANLFGDWLRDTLDPKRRQL